MAAVNGQVAVERVLLRGNLAIEALGKDSTERTDMQVLAEWYGCVNVLGLKTDFNVVAAESST